MLYRSQRDGLQERLMPYAATLYMPGHTRWTSQLCRWVVMWM